MARKVEIPKDGRIPVKICVELASDYDKVGYQLLGLTKEIDTIIPDDSPPMLLALRENYFKKYLGIISGHLRALSKNTKDFIFGEIKSNDDPWIKLGKDSERLAYFSHNILNAIEVLVPNESEDLKKLLDENFRKVLLITSGILKTNSYAIRQDKISKSKGE